MKKKGICLLAGVLLACIFLTGCGTEALPDTYVEGSDYQYTQWASGLFYPNVQQGDGVVYLFHNGFVYYLDEATGVIMPLCNKADCLHDQETDPEKLTACNAFMGTSEVAQIQNAGFMWNTTGIAKCDGYIYCLTEKVSGQQTIFRCSLDGTKKELVYTWDSEKSSIGEWIIHRNVLYYVEQRYYLEDGELFMEMSLKALPLTGLDRQPETIYVADKDLTVFTLGNPKAYGNYIYFEIIASRVSDEDTALEDDTYDKSYNRTLIYDIENDSVNELNIPDLPPSAEILGVQFWQDKIIINPYDDTEAADAPMPVYIAELDGSNPELLLEDIPQAGCFMSDGEYLYFFDDWMPDIDDWLSNPGLYTVYDRDLNIVDTFTVPLMDRSVRLPVGGTDWMYFQFTEEETGAWGVIRWDKSGIGTYNGGMIETTTIWYQ